MNDPYSVVINRKEHSLSVYKEDKLLKKYPVAVGKPSTPTPTGSYKIINKAMNPGGVFGVRWLGLNIPPRGYGIHGTNNPSSIGKSVSHGCIRMYNPDVIELYNLLSINTPVEIKD